MVLEKRIAVGIVIVSGGELGLNITSTEQTKIVSEVIKGGDFLIGAEPRANIEFVYDLIR